MYDVEDYKNIKGTLIKTLYKEIGRENRIKNRKEWVTVKTRSEDSGKIL